MESILCITLSEASEQEINFLRRAKSFFPKADISSYFIDSSVIITNSEKVFLNQKRLSSPQEYFFNTNSGDLFLRVPTDSADSICIEYQVLPDFSSRYFSHRSGWATDFAESEMLVKKKTSQSLSTAPPLLSESRLKLGGTKSIGFSMGNKEDFSLDQSLRLNLNGNLKKNISIQAVLTDQDLPIQPEGSTQTLQEIDRVFIEIQSPMFYTQMGDIQLNFDPSIYSSYQRKIQGAYGEVKTPSFSGGLGVAVSKGQYTIQRFRGQEQNQGPYFLTEEGKNSSMTILAGTEKIYLNGERLVRGDQQDYWIDYNAGEIFFSNKRLITSESDIVAEYEFVDDAYRQENYFARADVLKENSRINFKSYFIQESDDRENPQNFILTNENRDLLKKAGDSADRAIFTEIIQIHDTLVQKAVYEKVISSGETIFVHVPFEQVEVILKDSLKNLFSVDFYPRTQGDYRFGSIERGQRYYEYAGKGAGDYAPGRRLRLPERKILTGIEFRISPYPSVEALGGLRLSEHDRNTFAQDQISDQDNWGTSFNGSFHLKPRPLWGDREKLGRFAFLASLEGRSQNFNPLSHYRNEYLFEREWDIADSLFIGKELIQDYHLDYNLGEYFTLQGGWGYLVRNPLIGSQTSERTIFKCLLGNPRSLNLNYQFRQTQNYYFSNQTQMQRHLLSMVYPNPYIKPELSIEQEARKKINQEQTQYTKATAHFDILSFTKFNQTLGAEFRQDQIFSPGPNQDWIDSALAYTVYQEMQIKPSSYNHHEFRVTFRKRDLARATEQEQARFYLIESRNFILPFFQGLRARLDYQLNANVLRQLFDQYVRVDPGTGNYLLDTLLNQYYEVAWGEGNYQKETHLTDPLSATPIKNPKFSTELWLVPDKIPIFQRSLGWNRILQPFRFTLQFDLEEKSQNQKLLIPHLGQSQLPGQTLFHQLQQRYVVDLFQSQQPFNVRYRYFQIGRYEIRSASNPVNTYEQENQIRLQSVWFKLIHWQIDLYRKKHRNLVSSSQGTAYNILEYKMEHALQWSLGHFIRLKLEGILGEEEDLDEIVPITPLYYYAFSPEIQFHFLIKGRFTANYRWFKVEVPQGRKLYYFVAEGNGQGITQRWSLNGEYEINQYLRFFMIYQGKKYESEHPLHRANFELRAYF